MKSNLYFIQKIIISALIVLIFSYFKTEIHYSTVNLNYSNLLATVLPVSYCKNKKPWKV